MPDLLAEMVSGEWLDQQDFSGQTEARELVESGKCSGACLVAAPETLDSCDCVCEGRYHSAIANTLIDISS